MRRLTGARIAEPGGAPRSGGGLGRHSRRAGTSEEVDADHALGPQLRDALRPAARLDLLAKAHPLPIFDNVREDHGPRPGGPVSGAPVHPGAMDDGRYVAQHTAAAADALSSAVLFAAAAKTRRVASQSPAARVRVSTASADSDDDDVAAALLGFGHAELLPSPAYRLIATP